MSFNNFNVDLDITKWVPTSDRLQQSFLTCMGFLVHLLDIKPSADVSQARSIILANTGGTISFTGSTHLKTSFTCTAVGYTAPKPLRNIVWSFGLFLHDVPLSVPPKRRYQPRRRREGPQISKIVLFEFYPKLIGLPFLRIKDMEVMTKIRFSYF